MPFVNLTINNEIKLIENESLSAFSEGIAPDMDTQPEISAAGQEDKAEDELAELRARLQAMIGGYLPEFYEFQRTGRNILYPKPVDIEALQARVNAMQVPPFMQPRQKRLEQAAGAFLDRFRLFRKEKEWHNNALDFIKFRLALKDAGWDSPQARDDCEALKYANRISDHLSGTLHLIRLLSDSPEQQISWECARKKNYDELLRELLPIDTEDNLNQSSARTRGNLNKNHPDNIKFNAIVNSVTQDERMARKVLSEELEGGAERLLSDIVLTRYYAENTEGKNENKRLARDILTLCLTLQDIIESIKYQGMHIRPLTDRPLVEYQLSPQAETLTETIKQGLVTSWNTVRIYAQEYTFTLGIAAGKIEKNVQRILYKYPNHSNALYMHTARYNINEAIFRVGIILLDKVQQTTAGIHKARLACYPLQQAVTHYNGLRRVLSDIPPNKILDTKLYAESERWRKKIEELKTSLLHSLREITTLAEENMKQKFLSALRDELNHAPGVMASDCVISDFDTQLKEAVEALASIEKEMNPVLLRLSERGEAGTKELHKHIMSELQHLKFIKNNLKTSVIKATGRSINNFSRQGMLARRMAEWNEAEKQRYLRRFSVADQAVAEKIYNSLFLELAQHYLPLLSGESDPEGNRLLQRLRLEMGNAAKGTTLYPATMDEIITGMKSRNQVIRDWAGRKLVRMVFLAACLEGINLIPNLAALPLRMAIKFAMTGTKVAWAARKGRQGIRGGEGDISGGVREYAKRNYKTAALKIVLSLPPGLTTLLGVSSVCFDVYEGKLEGAGKKIAKTIIGEAPWRALDVGSRTAVVAYTTTLVDAAVNTAETESVSHSPALPPQADTESHSDNRDHNAIQTRSRNKRSFAAEVKPAQHSNIQEILKYSNFSKDKKKSTYLYGIKYALFKMENDESLSRNIRNNAYLARTGASLLVPVDIYKYKLNNTFLLPDYPGSKSGMLVRLDSDKLYYYVSKGAHILPNIKWAMPFDAKEWRSEQVPSNSGIGYTPFFNGFSVVNKLRGGIIEFHKFFNFNNPKAISINNLATLLEKTIAEDYKKKSIVIQNENLMKRAILGAQIPDQGVSVTEVKYRLEFDWSNLKPDEYLRSFSQPFAILGGQMQLIFSNAEGETLQQAKQNIILAEYIGAWIDLTSDVATAFTPAGLAIGLAQSAADIGADMLEHKSPNILNIVSLILTAIPEAKIAAKVGMFSHVAGHSVKYGLMIGKKVVDLAVVGTSIKAAEESGEPLAIYQALTTCGLSARSTYHLTKNITSALKISKKMEESATLEELEALKSNLPEYAVSSNMPFRTIMIGATEVLARINKGKIEICRHGGFLVEKGSELHLAAYRLENARKVRESSKDKMSTFQTYSPSIEKTLQHDSGAQEMLYSGFSGSRELTFAQTTHHQINLNKITKFLLARKFKNAKARTFDYVSLKFKKNNGFTVASNASFGSKFTENISPASIIVSIDDMGRKTSDMIKNISKYSGGDKDDVLNNLVIIQRGLVDTKRMINSSDNDYNSVYILTKTGASSEFVTNHYGLATFRYDIQNSDLRLDFLMAHPYVVINKYPAVVDFLANNDFISREQFHKYNIKNVSRFLGTKAICSELECYEAIPGEDVKTFSFNGVNPITQSIGYQLESISKLFSKKSTRDIPGEPDYSSELDIPSTTTTGIHDYHQSLEILRSHVRDSFASVKPPETISAEATEVTIQKIMQDYDAEILSEKIIDGLESPDEEVKAFSGEVISSVDHAYEKISKVKSLFDQAEFSSGIKVELKGLLDEATGLNDDVLVDIDKKDISSISDMVYDRFKSNIEKIHCYLSEQKKSNYDVFVLYKYRHPGSPKAQAIALPYGNKKKIMVAMLPQDKRRGGLVDTVVHEVLHNAADARDHTYIGDMRAKRGSFPSSFEVSARKTEHFIANNQSKIDNIRYALDLPQSIVPTERQKHIAHAILHNSKLIKADALLNSAEYNAYMIHVLSRARVEGSNIKLDDGASRSKRSVDESGCILDNAIMLALLGVSLPKYYVDFNPFTFSQALEIFINRDVKMPVHPHFFPYLAVFESIPKSQKMTLQQVNELGSEQSAKPGDLLAKAKYQYAVLAYLSRPEEIKLPVDVIRHKIIQSKEKILDEYQKEQQRNIDIRKQLAKALLENHRIKKGDISTVASETQAAAESKINDLLIKNKSNADLIFQHSRKLDLISKKLALWDSAFI